MTYGREVIVAPKDAEQRLSSPWARSCSDLYHAFAKRFGPQTIVAAKSASASILGKKYNGDKRTIPHVNKKASYLRYRESSKLGAIYYPQDNMLATGCFECTIVPCSLAFSSFLPAEEVFPVAYLAHVGACDDYGSFTQEDYDVRLRMVALSAGVAYQYGGKLLNICRCNSAPIAR
jgi:hypothetical protein